MDQQPGAEWPFASLRRRLGQLIDQERKAGSRVNIARRVNRTVVINGGRANSISRVSSRQTAPIRQDGKPEADLDDELSSES